MEGILTIEIMKRSLDTPIAPGRRLRACVCLVALALLWAPVWGAVWQAGGMGCCNGGMCAAHGHSMPNQHGPKKTSPAEAPMNCEHDGGSGFSQCAMSCSHESAPSM